MCSHGLTIAMTVPAGQMGKVKAKKKKSKVFDFSCSYSGDNCYIETKNWRWQVKQKLCTMKMALQIPRCYGLCKETMATDHGLVKKGEQLK